MAGQERAEAQRIYYRQLELILPPINLVLPPKSFTLSAEACLVQYNFISSPHVVIDATSATGLGDCIIDLRPAVMLATRYPKKKFTVQVLPEIINIRCLGLPANLELISDGLNILADEKDVFFIVFAPGGALYLPDEWKRRKLDSQKRIYNERKLAAPKPRNRSALDDLSVAENDIRLLLCLFLMGVDIASEAEIDPAILNLSSVQELNSEPAHDLLIAPDTKEFQDAQGQYSNKSLSVDGWSDIFEILLKTNKNLRVALVEGHAHPKYTREVFMELQKRSPHAQLVVTPTLQDFCQAVLQCQTFVGMDSGTTHLAAEVVKAARQQGRQIFIRELFCENIMTPEDYGIRGLRPCGRILAYQAPTDYNLGLKAKYFRHFSEEAARFILS